MTPEVTTPLPSARPTFLNNPRVVVLDFGIKSTDAGATWAEVESFPNPGDYVAQPGDPYAGDVQGVVWAAFDPRSGGDGEASQDVYVGVADEDDHSGVGRLGHEHVVVGSPRRGGEQRRGRRR